MSIIERAVEKLTIPEQPEAPVEGRVEGEERRPPSDALKTTSRLGESPEQRRLAAVVSESEPLFTGLLQQAGEKPATAGQPARVQKSDSSPSAYKAKVDLASLTAAGMVTPENANAPIAEQFRVIKRPLLMNAALAGSGAIKRSNLIMVTSSVPNEGKSFVAINLAMSMAMEMDRTILLVDADSMKSDCTRRLGISNVEGLTELLSSKDAELRNFLIKTDIPNLTVLSSGRPHPRLTELYGSEEMAALAEELSERYQDRIVIFDTPPLLAASGTGVLAPLMGQIVMVVEAQKTGQGVLQEALRQLENCASVSLVLNKTHQESLSEYQYGYHKYYTTYYGYGRQ